MERKVVIFDHPLIQHKLSILRNEQALKISVNL